MQGRDPSLCFRLAPLPDACCALSPQGATLNSQDPPPLAVTPPHLPHLQVKHDKYSSIAA